MRGRRLKPRRRGLERVEVYEGEFERVGADESEIAPDWLEDWWDVDHA